MDIRKIKSDDPIILDLLEYIRELEGYKFENDLTKSKSKENIYKEMLIDILNSCSQYNDNKLLNDRYPHIYQKIESDILIDNLRKFIVDMNNNNRLGLI